MKKFILILIIFICALIVDAQDSKPSGSVNLQSPSWVYNPTTHKIGMYKNLTYQWNEFFSAKVTQFKIDSLGNLIGGANHDSLTIAPGSINYFAVNYPQIFSGQGIIDTLSILKGKVALNTMKVSFPGFGTLAGDYGFSDSNYAKLNAANIFTNAGTNTFTGNIQATTAKLTNLTDGYIPYHVSDASGLGDSPLSVSGTNVGIGTTTPYSKLDVRGGNIVLTTSDFALGSVGSVLNFGLGAETGDTFSFIQASQNGDYLPANLVLNRFGGNVGIGTTSPASMLDVNGTISKDGTALFLDKFKSGLMGSSGQIPVANSSTTDFTWTSRSAINLSSFNNDLNIYSVNDSLQALSGTSPTWDLSHGRYATLTVSGHTVITLSSVVVGSIGTIFITNPATAYGLKFFGYNVELGPNIDYDSNGMICSGASKYDSFTFVYTGTKLIIHANFDYTSQSW